MFVLIAASSFDHEFGTLNEAHSDIQLTHFSVRCILPLGTHFLIAISTLQVYPITISMSVSN